MAGDAVIGARTATCRAELLGGPRDGERDVRVPITAPPRRLPGCCRDPDPQTRDSSLRCFSCGADGDDAIHRYELAAAAPSGALVYRHVPVLPRRERRGTTP